MADNARNAKSWQSVRDASFVHASLPFFRSLTARRLTRSLAPVLLACVAALPLAAQVPRPWLDWHSIETEHFVLHYPEQYRVWTLALAARIEGVRSQVEKVVGFVPAKRVHIVVDDPVNDANGSAFTTLDAPTIVLWPTAPDPREEIGNYRVWSDLLATHEFAHVAHLNRPSRNWWRRLLWDLSPVPLGPIAVNAPRWALEGYATYVEGRVSGTGRPNHAWRAAVLRQFALEGRLPSYSQLNASGSWETGSFAYLAGSAFLEWLARREGDSSVTALWRRMTARTDRSFDDAFTGVYGGGPAHLYGRFSAELTADALAFERTMARDALVPGTLVQRLLRDTGDPAISPDGRFVALLVRRPDKPSRITVWKTADEPDTLSARRREQEQKRDPEDVPDRSFYPPPKREVITLAAADGAPYESPRWLPDNTHLLLTRRMPMSDGTLRPDLFMWSAEFGTLSRITYGAAVREADPAPDGRWAAAVRCDHGWCDLVRVDLLSGAVRVIRAGSPARNYYRPRISRRTGEIVVAEQDGDRWRIARVAPVTGELTYADPDDGVTRYDATFDVDGRTIVTTSEAGGIANLERLDPVDAHATRLTSVTGAAVAGDVAPDGTVWFLSLTASGYDLRSLRSDSASIARARNASLPLHLALVDSISPVLPPRITASTSDSSRRPPAAALGSEEDYGTGPSRYRWVPAASSGFGGSTTSLALVRSDPVGRLGVAIQATVGAAALPTGISVDIQSRLDPTKLSLSAWTSHEAPSRILRDAFGYGLDLRRIGGAVQLERLSVTDGGEMVRSVAWLEDWQNASAFGSVVRSAAIAALNVVRRQRDDDSRYDDTRYEEHFDALFEAGSTEGGSYFRQRSTLFFGTSTGTRPLTTVVASYGTIGGSNGALRERFVIGGIGSPLMDPKLDARRVDAPAYPLGSSAATSYTSIRATLPIPPLELFYSGASTDLFRTPLRSYGMEMHQHVAAVAAMGTPELELLTGFARAVDDPAKGEWRYYVSVTLRP